MLRVIDLDQVLKDREADGVIFTITIGHEKFAISSDDVAELIRAKAAAPARGGKRTPKGRPPAGDGAADGGREAEANGEADHRPLNSWSARGAD